MANRSTSARRPLRFERVRLENWRNFRSVNVSLQQRAFLVGPNASGKSNLLDVFRFLHDIVSVGGGFEQAILRRGGVTKLRCLAARRYPDVAIGVDVVSGSGEERWTYEISFTQDNRARPYLKSERIEKNGSLILDRPDSDDKRDPDQLKQTHLEQVRVNKEFRDLATYFQSIDYFHVVPQLMRNPERYRGQANDPFGWDFLEKISRTPSKTRNAWLRRLRGALRIAVPQLQEFELWKDDRGVPHLRGRYEHWRPHGAWQTEEVFSDGTLRLLGLLWAVLDGSGPLLLEEPELSLHSEVIRHIPQMLARMQRRTGRQVILSTHSPDLLGDPGIAPDEVLVLEPGLNGTNVTTAGEFEDVIRLLEGGLDLADAVVPRTRPGNAAQLSLFGD